MTGIVHKYVRRFIRWVKTPSSEDDALHQAFLEEAREQNLRRRLRNLIRGREHAFTKELCGLSRREVQDCLFVMRDIIREDGDISVAKATRAFVAICGHNGQVYGDMIRDGLVPSWPFNPPSGERTA